MRRLSPRPESCSMGMLANDLIFRRKTMRPHFRNVASMMRGCFTQRRSARRELGGREPVVDIDAACRVEISQEAQLGTTERRLMATIYFEPVTLKMALVKPLVRSDTSL